MNSLQIFGICFFVYGILKLALFFAMVFIPHDIQEKLHVIPGMKLVMSGDKTVAGKWIEYLLAIFAVFSIVHALAILDFLPGRIDDFVESLAFQYTFYTLCGVTTMVFYTLVLYSNIPISKNPENDKLYKIYGYLIGLSFLLVPIIWQAYIHLFPYFSKIPLRHQFTLFMLIFFVLVVIVTTVIVVKN